MSETLKAELSKAIIDGEQDAAASIAKQIVDSKVDIQDIIKSTLSPAMKIVGDKFEDFEYFLADMMLSAEAMKTAMNIFAPHLKTQSSEEKQVTIILGTVKGDIHNIGKNIFRVLLEVDGFKVVDLGEDNSPMEFLKAAEENKSKIIAQSTLLSTSIPYMEELDRLLNDRGERQKYKIMVGGGPITEKIAKDLHADGFSVDAAEGVRVARKLGSE